MFKHHFSRTSRGYTLYKKTCISTICYKLLKKWAYRSLIAFFPFCIIGPIDLSLNYAPMIDRPTPSFRHIPKHALEIYTAGHSVRGLFLNMRVIPWEHFNMENRGHSVRDYFENGGHSVRAPHINWVMQHQRGIIGERRFERGQRTSPSPICRECTPPGPKRLYRPIR